ncbi:MAG: nitroreductase family protein [Coriobacteriia bacterium]|nr:nitroreductase family protein [Coriobacteriia bacterium]
MELDQALRLRQSTRSFTSEPITAAELQELLVAAQSAPLALGDHATTQITVVQSPGTLAVIKKACEMHSAKTGAVRDPYYGAPLVIFVSATDISDDHIEYSNAACIIENIILQAAALGLGSVYIWGCLRKLRANPEALARLDLPEGYEVLSAVAVGHAAEPLAEREPTTRVAVKLV